MIPVKSVVFDVPQESLEAPNNQVDQDKSVPLKACLNEAGALAKKLDAELTLFCHVHAPGAALETWLQGTVLHNAQDELVAKQTSRLENLAENILGLESPVKVKVVWAKNFDDAADEAFADQKPDLIIQPSRHHLFAASLVRQPSEWRLIRYPDVPVLLQRQAGSLVGKTLLALDVGEAKASQKKNIALITHMKALCEALGTELHLINAYPSAADLMAFAPVEWTIPQIQDTLQEQHYARLCELAKEVDIDTSRVHVGEGSVSEVMDVWSKKLNIALVVIASHCRDGVSGFFIGNTAEIVLDQTRLNMLVLKPA